MLQVIDARGPIVALRAARIDALRLAFGMGRVAGAAGWVPRVGLSSIGATSEHSVAITRRSAVRPQLHEQVTLEALRPVARRQGQKGSECRG